MTKKLSHNCFCNRIEWVNFLKDTSFLYMKLYLCSRSTYQVTVNVNYFSVFQSNCCEGDKCNSAFGKYYNKKNTDKKKK